MLLLVAHERLRWVTVLYTHKKIKNVWEKFVLGRLVKIIHSKIQIAYGKQSSFYGKKWKLKDCKYRIIDKLTKYQEPLIKCMN